MKIQWRGDNLGEIQQALASILARAEKDTDQILITGVNGLEVTVDLGDTIELRGDNIGVHRPSSDQGREEHIWTGENVPEIAAFVDQWGLDVSVIGSSLFITQPGCDALTINRGDKLIKTHGRYFFVSRAGRDHRV